MQFYICSYSSIMIYNNDTPLIWKHMFINAKDWKSLNVNNKNSEITYDYGHLQHYI